MLIVRYFTFTRVARYISRHRNKGERAMTDNQENETTQTPEELLAIRLGLKLKNGKPDVKKLQQLIFQEVVKNSENITSIDVIGKAIKSYTNLKVLQLNEEKKNAAYERLENAINEMNENGEKITKSKLNRKYGFSYKTLGEYEKLKQITI